MKKLIKISLVVIAASLFFLNVSFTTNNNRVEMLGITPNAKIAYGQWIDECFWSWLSWDCTCDGLSYYCAAECFDDCPGVIIEG